MPWTLNKNNKRPIHDLTWAEQGKLNDFMDAVRRGKSPSEAAPGHGYDFKKLQGSQYQIRLSQGKRATFLVDDHTQTVTIMEVGGHT